MFVKVQFNEHTHKKGFSFEAWVGWIRTRRDAFGAMV